MPWHRADHAHPDLKTPTQWWTAVYDRYAAVFRAAECKRVLADESFEALRWDILDAGRYTLFDDAVAVLSRLQQQGWRQIIVSNHVPELDSLISGLGLAPYFAAVVSSGVVGYEKPHRRVFEAAVAQTPPGSRIWMIGDNIDSDCRPVAAFGAGPILVRNDDAARRNCGLRAPDLHQALELLEAGAVAS